MAVKFGASDWRIIVKHIIPNSITLVITFAPFALAGGISSLTALGFSCFGISHEYPSWGNLLKQGQDYLQDAYWIGGSILAGDDFDLVLVTFTKKPV